jgi:hypothetical protein
MRARRAARDDAVSRTKHDPGAKTVKLADIEVHCLLRVYCAAQSMRNLSG